jgi:excisionase family DNA binding protein
MVNGGKAVAQEILIYEPKELFKLIKVSKNTGYQLLRSGAIKSVKAARKILIPRKSVEDWLSGGERGND